MKINYKATNIELNDEIRDYFEKRIKSVAKVTDVEDPTFMMDVELGKTTNHHQQGDIFRAEINLNVGGKLYRSVTQRNDLYSAIDESKNDLVQELRKDKGRKLSFLRRGGSKLKGFIKGLYGHNEENL